MTGKALAAVAVAVIGLVVAGTILAGAVLGNSLATAACGPTATIIPAATASTTADVGPSPTNWPTIGTWTPDQVANAATVINVGRQLGVPARGWIIALATAMRESGLTNLTTAKDHDSLGLFQQRPSQGWGTPAQLTDPVYATTKFYQKLQTIPDWQDMPLTQAAQAVQHSAYPDAYATYEANADQMVAALTGIDGVLLDCSQNSGGLLAPPPGFSLPTGTPPAVATAIAWAFAQLGTPYTLDGDCTAAHSGNPAHQCDCSSLVQQAYRAAGVILPRTAAEQSHVGTLIIDPDQLQPGDLLFVPGADGTPTNPGHVGMYIGNNMIIEAPHTGETVRIVQASQYWLTDLTIRRVILSGPVGTG